jgi:hypothetical protein
MAESARQDGVVCSCARARPAASARSTLISIRFVMVDNSPEAVSRGIEQTQRPVMFVLFKTGSRRRA